MTDFDEQIRDALQAEQDAIFEADDDVQALVDSMKFMFRGQSKWFTMLHISFIVAFLTLAVVSAIQFFQVESTRAMIAWATGFAVSIILEALAELYFMIEVNKHMIRWEVKQLELQVASLAGNADAHRGSVSDE